MPPFLQILASIFGTLGVYGLFLLAQYLYREATSPLNALPGPPNSSWIYGNSKEIQDAETSVTQEKWVEEYGTTFAYKWFLGKRLYTVDTVALNHILMSGYDYQKPEALRNWILKNVVGSGNSSFGILVQEEDEHRRQRKVMNPAFGVAQIRELTEIFVDESLHLRDIWLSQIGADNGPVRVDVQSWLSRMTLDVIGRAGFNHRFNALDSTEPDELSKAFSVIFGISSRFTLWNDVLQGLFPLLRVFVRTSFSDIAEAKKPRSLWNVSAEIFSGKAKNTSLQQEKKEMDILEHQRMSDEDVISQVPTFLVAGHETTSTAVTWALYALTQDKEIQCKLREELLQVSTESPTMDILNSLPYLDAVVRETLRVYSPVTGTERVAMKDDILPLGVPFTDKNGEVHNDIRVRKGDLFNIPVLAVNRSKALWGEDARDFKPERWLTPGGVPSNVASIPGVWGNMLSFLGGAHACIGYRFSLVEMKALLFVLIRAFEFELAVSPEDIVGKSSIVRRIHLKSEPEKGSAQPHWYDMDHDQAFFTLPQHIQRRIDAAFLSAIKHARSLEATTSRHSDLDSAEPPLKRRKISTHTELTVDSGGGFIVDIPKRYVAVDNGQGGGGFILNDTDVVRNGDGEGGGGFIIDVNTSNTSAGGFVREDEQENEGVDDSEPFSLPEVHDSSQIPLSSIPTALQLLDLPPDDEQVLAIFRNAASGWDNHDGSRTDDNLAVTRADWRAVCTILLEPGVGDDGMADGSRRQSGSPGGDGEYVEEDVEDDVDMQYDDEPESDDDYEPGPSSATNFKSRSTRRPTPATSKVSVAGGKRRTRGTRLKTAETDSDAGEDTDDDQERTNSRTRRLTARQKATCLEAFRLFFPDAKDDLPTRRILLADIQRVAKLLGEKLKAEEVIELQLIFNLFVPD
ncbi:hypothetical protein HHX47_DHR9000464 [Lentinula edodes]|nr:hypothetical protein HHX47_DHR9000464 [Lentinula edodes]